MKHCSRHRLDPSDVFDSSVPFAVIMTLLLVLPLKGRDRTEDLV
jgi:hypothetical protein